MFRLIFIALLCFMFIGCGNEAVLIPIGAGSWLNFDRRTAKTIIDDQAITVKANVALAKDKTIWKNSHISTLSYNNAILLVGQTTNQAYKDKIEKIVQKVGGVGTIYNQVSVSDPISLSTRTNDTWITTQVKTRIMSNRNVGINRVKVITENGVVYLMGALTKDEEHTTVMIARCVPCVKKVVTVIERERAIEGQSPPRPVPPSNCKEVACP